PPCALARRASPAADATWFSTCAGRARTRSARASATPFFPGTATALTPHSPRPAAPPRGLAGIHHRDRGVIRPPLVMGRRPLHPRLLGARSQTRRSDLQVDAPPRVIVERPPPIRPPRVRAVLIRVQRPHHVDVSRLLIHPGKPLPLFRKETR